MATDAPRHPHIQHTLDDLLVMGKTLWAECRSEPFEGQVAVAWVIRNRMDVPRRWGRSPREVCLQARQFSCWNPDDPQIGMIAQLPVDAPRLLRAVGICALVLSGDLPDHSHGANHYFTVEKPSYAQVWPPAWSRDMVETVVIARHRFFRG